MIKPLYLLAFVGAALSNPVNPRSDTRVINGATATTGTFPWQVSLQYRNADSESGYWHFCGGSLISQSFIMTAAHCYHDPRIVTVYAGSVDKFYNGVRLDVANFIQHPQYNSDASTMDYGLVHLTEPVEFSDTIQPIPIIGPDYDASSNFAGPAIATGWGYDYYVGPNNPADTFPEMLQVADIDVLSDQECFKFWPTVYKPSSMICAGGKMFNGEGICMGDSGGPLIQEINGIVTLIGDTSWAPSSCSTTEPSGWAKLSAARQWILDNTNGELQ